MRWTIKYRLILTKATKVTIFYVVESRYASYQRYVSVTKGQAFKGRCYHIIIVPPNGIKNLVVLVDSVFQKQLLYEAEELAEPTRAHLWNKGSEIRLNLCTVVSLRDPLLHI